MIQLATFISNLPNHGSNAAAWKVAISSLPWMIIWHSGGSRHAALSETIYSNFMKTPMLTFTDSTVTGSGVYPSYRCLERLESILNGQYERMTEEFLLWPLCFLDLWQCERRKWWVRSVCLFGKCVWLNSSPGFRRNGSDEMLAAGNSVGVMPH